MLGDSACAPGDPGLQWHLEAAATNALYSTGSEDKHVLRALWNPAVLICGELAQFLALDYPTKLSQGRF